jgi:predicted dehydrogenase
MNQGNLSRRGFMAKSLTAMSIGAGMPVWYAKEMLADAQEQPQNQPAANERVVVGSIGTGTNRFRSPNGMPTGRGERGIDDMRAAIGTRGVQVVAVCDVDSVNRDFAANIVGRDCAKFDDFRELLARRDIDAVTIGTPDHWHAIIAIAAMKAGKHVYCEKPLALTLDEGKAIVKVQRETGKVFQTGSQQRTEFGGRFRLACEMVRNGRLGTIKKVTSIVSRNGNPQGGPFNTESVPNGLNWDFWQGPTPDTPFIKQRAHYEFRWWYDYSGGKMTDWGAHMNDTVQCALNMDATGPIAVTGAGITPPPGTNVYNVHPQFVVNYIYGNGPNGSAGTLLECRSNFPTPWNHSREEGVLFEGDDNKWIWVGRGTIAAHDGTDRTSRILNDPLGANDVRLERAPNHMANFIDCCRTGRLPICNAQVGHRSASVCHLGNIATRFLPGLRLTWDPQAERFTGEYAQQANSHLSRPYRAPWQLGA